MKKSELKQIIREELLKEVYGSVLDYFYTQGYSAGQILNSLVDELVKTKGEEGAKKHIGSLVGDEPQYDMSSRTPFGEGALMDQGGWDYNLMDQIEDKVEELNSIIGKYDNEEIINLINEIIRDLEQLKNK